MCWKQTDRWVVVHIEHMWIVNIVNLWESNWARLRTLVLWSSTNTHQLIFPAKTSWKSTKPAAHLSITALLSSQCRELLFSLRSNSGPQGRFAQALNIFLCFCSVEVSPCLEPSYCLQKTRTMKFSVHETEDVGFVKYMPKSLLLPINTFAGVIQWRKQEKAGVRDVTLGHRRGGGKRKHTKSRQQWFYNGNGVESCKGRGW